MKNILHEKITEKRTKITSRLIFMFYAWIDDFIFDMNWFALVQLVTMILYANCGLEGDFSV